MFGRFTNFALSDSPSYSHVAPSTPSKGDGADAATGGRIRRGGTRSIHSQRLQSAMDDLQKVLRDIKHLDPRTVPPLDDVGDDSMPEASNAPSSPDRTDRLGAASDFLACVAHTSDPREEPGGTCEGANIQASSTDGGDDEHDAEAPQHFRTGQLLEYQREVLHEYDNAMPPLRTLRFRTSAAHAARFSASQSAGKPIEQDFLSPAGTRRLDVLRRRGWLELPDDMHELRCLMNGVDPTLASSRLKKTQRWFDGKPLYSPAVLLLAQVSQQQVQAMKKKHGKRLAGGADGSNGGNDGVGEGKGGTMSLDPPLKEPFHPFPRLAERYFDNDVYPLAYHDSRITPQDVAALLIAGEQRMRGVDKLQSFVSFRSIRRSSNGAADGTGAAEFLEGIGSSSTASSMATDTAVEHLLASARSCVVISTTDASLAFAVFPATPALPLFKPAPRRPLQRRLSLMPFSATSEPYTVSWVEQWQQYLASEVRRYSNPRTAAKMYQALSLIHPNGTDCRMWVVKRLIRWILKAKRSLLRFTLLRCRLVYSARKPHSECASLMLPAELATMTPRMPTPDAVPPSPGDNASTPSPTGPPVTVEEEEDTALIIDPLPLQDSGGVMLVRSSARRELLHGDIFPLPQRPKMDETGEVMSEEAKESLRKAMQERIGAEVVVNVVVVPSFDHVSQQQQDATNAEAQDRDDAQGGRVAGPSRSEGVDSFVETLTTKLCELIVSVESDLRLKETVYRTVAAEVHHEIVDLQLKSGGVIHARKKRAVPRSDGVQLGLVKSAAAVDAQERANPVTTAINGALRQFHRFVVHDVILAPKGEREGSAGTDGIVKSPNTTTPHGGEHAPGIVSLRELIASAFRDESRTAPDWTRETSTSKSRSGAGGSVPPVSVANDSDVGDEVGDTNEATEAETAALKAFLRPVLRIDPVGTGNFKSNQLPYRLFQPAHMDFLENLHTFDDASLFNLRRRERCASSAEVIEEITELFQRLVEILTNIDSMSHDFNDTQTSGTNTTTNFSQAVAHRRAKRAGGATAVTPSSQAEAAAAKKAAGQPEPLIPRKQFGSVLRVLIDRMVRRFLVNIMELLRMLTNNGRSSDTPLLDIVDEVRGGGAGAMQRDGSNENGNASHESSRRTSMVFGATAPGGALGACDDPEPQFSRLTEYTAACDGNRPQHRLCDFLQGWRWFVGNATTVALIWGPGKDVETDRDRMYDQMVVELRSLQREPLSSYAAFGGANDGNGHRGGRGSALSMLHHLGETLESNLSVTAPIAVAECCPLDGDDLDAICALFPTVQNAGDGSRLDARRSSDRKASVLRSSETRTGVLDGAGATDFGTTSAKTKQPKLTPYVGEEQFLFTILHILDMCHVSVESHASLSVDGAAHLRSEGGRGKRKKPTVVSRARKGGSKKGSNAVMPFPPNSIDARDSLFFRWRFILKLQPVAFAKDIRHCTLTLFEKNVSRDLLVDALMSLRQTLRSMFSKEEEVHRVALLDARRAQELQPMPEDHDTILANALPGDESNLQQETALAEMLKKRAINKRLGLEMTADRRLYINCLMSRLNVALQALTKEDRCVMAGVKELLETAPPSERECFLLVQQMFAKEFEKWDAHRSLVDPPAAPVCETRIPLLSVSPAANAARASDAATPRLEGWVKASDSARSSVSSPRGLKISIPAASTTTPLLTPMGTARSIDTLGQSLSLLAQQADGGDDVKNDITVASLRCERCHQPPASLLFRHKHQPRKRVIAYTEDEIEALFGDPSSLSASRRSSEASGQRFMGMSPHSSRRPSCTAFGGGPPKHLTKVVTEFRDVFVCTACFAQYLAHCLVRKLIDAMHAARAAEAADAAAAAAAMADKMRKQMNKELFGAHIPDEVTSDLFEQVQEVVRRRERDAQKRAEQQRRQLEGDGSSSEDDDDDSDSDGGQGGGLFGRKRAKKKKKKKANRGEDDDDFSALAPGAAKKKRRNVLEDKLAAVMVGVQREQLIVHEASARVAMRKEALDAFNKLRVDLARAAYVDRHGVEPTSLDDLIRDQSLVLDVESEDDESDAAQQKHLQAQQAEADRLMTMARQQSQSKLGSFKRTASVVGRSGSIVKFVGKPPTGESVACPGSGPDDVPQGEVDEFGLPPLRSHSGLSIDQLRQRIEDAENDIGNNKLMMLKKDLEERLLSLQVAKGELLSMMQLYEERKRQHEEFLRKKAEAQALEREADEKKKKAASLRTAVEKFKLKINSKTNGSTPLSTTVNGDGAQLTDDDIIRMAEEAKKQQEATTDRLFRGANRRESTQKVERNVFDEDDDAIEDLLSGNDHDDTPLRARHTGQWGKHVDTWLLPSDDAAVAFRSLCRNGSIGGLLHEQSQLAAKAYGCPPGKDVDGPSDSNVEGEWTAYHVRHDFVLWRQSIADNASATGCQRKLMPVTDEWFSNGEADEVFHARDDSLMLMSYINRILDPLHWMLARESPTAAVCSSASSLRDVILQCAFVQEAASTLLDVSCGLVRRTGMHPEHLEGYPIGDGGAMLALYGIGHPLEQELFQAIGAPTNAAAVARAMQHLHEAARMMSPGNVGASASAAGNKYHPEHLLGDAQRAIAKFSRLFLSRVHTLRRRNGKLSERLTMVAVPTARQQLGHAGAATALPASCTDGAAANREDSGDREETWSPAVAALAALDDALGDVPDATTTELRAEFTFEGDAIQPPTSMGDVGNENDEGEDENGDPSEGQRLSPWAVLRQAIKDTTRSDAGLGPSTDEAETADQHDGNGRGRRRSSRRLSKLAKKPVSEPEPVAATPSNNEKPRGFKEKLRKAAQATKASLLAGEEEKRMGCLAEVILPGIEFVAPDGDAVHPSVTQAWWQVRLLVVALHRHYHARGFLSFRTLWVYARRLLRRDLRILLADATNDDGALRPTTAGDCCATLFELFARRYRLVEDKTQQRRAPPVASSPRLSTSVTGGVKGEHADDGHLAASPTSFGLDATLTSLPPHSPDAVGGLFDGTMASTSVLGSPPPMAISLMHSPSGTIGGGGGSVTFVDLPRGEDAEPFAADDDGEQPVDDDRAASDGRVAPPRASSDTHAVVMVKKYIKASTPLSSLQQQVRTNVLTLFHTHVALGHHALEEYSAGLLRAFTTIPGAPEALLRPLDCLRLANSDILRKLRVCVSTHFDAVMGVERTHDGQISEGDANRMIDVVKDLGRLALAIFVLGPVVEARSVLALSGLESFDADHHTADIRMPRGTAVSDCFDLVRFVEGRLFPGSGTLDDDADDAQLPESLSTPAAAADPPDNANDGSREAAAVDAVISEPVSAEAALSAWDDDDQHQPSTARRSSHPQTTTPLPASARASSSPQGNKRHVAKTYLEISPLHRRVLRVVDHLLFHTHGSEPRMDDDQRMKHLLDCSAHAFFYAVPPVDLIAYGVEFALYVFSAGADGDASHVVVGSRFHTPFRFLSSVASTGASCGAKEISDAQRLDAAETASDALRQLALGVSALRTVRDEAQAVERGVEGSEATDGAAVGPATSARLSAVEPAEASVLSASRRPSNRRSVEHRVVRIETAETDGTNRDGGTATAPHTIVSRAVLTALELALGWCYARLHSDVGARDLMQPPATSGVPLLPLPWGDPHGGSAMTLHRYMTENLPTAQLRLHEEVRRRQRVFNRSLHAMLVRAAPLEAKKLFQSIDAELPAGSPTLQDLFRHSVSDDDESWAIEERMSKNPLDVLRSQRMSRLSLTDALAEQLRETFRSQDSSHCHDSSFNTGLDAGGHSSASSAVPHQSGNAALVGEASSPYVSKGQRGSVMMERLLQKAADRAAMHIAMDDIFQFSSRGIASANNDGQFAASMGSDLRGAGSTPPTTADAASTSLNNTLSQLRRMSIKMNRSIGSGLPPGLCDGVWDHGVTVSMAYTQLQQEAEKARLRWIRKGGSDTNVTPRRKAGGKDASIEDRREQRRGTVQPRLLSLADDDDEEGADGRDAEGKGAAYAESIRRGHGGPKEITERDVRRFRSSRKKSVDMALLDATGLLSTAEKQLNEFFVPVLSVACQLMEFSDRTRSDLHRYVPPQWVEDSETFMILQLHRRAQGDMEPTIAAAFLHDVQGNIVDAQGDEYGSLFASYQPGHAWRPGAPRPAFPWVECTITRKKGIYTLECVLGTYRISERVLRILVVSADPPRIHVTQDRGALDSFVFDPTNEEGYDDAVGEGGRVAPRLPARQEFSALADDAALSAILHRNAMLRRFMMPSSTLRGTRISYSSRDPYDPDRVVRLEDERHRNYEGLYPVVHHASPTGLLTSQSASADEGGPTMAAYTNVDITGYAHSTDTAGAMSPSPRQRVVFLPPINDASPKPRGKLASSPSKLQHLRDALDGSTTERNRQGGVAQLPSLIQSAKVRGSNDDQPSLGDAPVATKVLTKWSQLLPKVAVASRK